MPEEQITNADEPLPQLLFDLFNLSSVGRIQHVDGVENAILERIHKRSGEMLHSDWSTGGGIYSSFTSMCRVLLTQIVQWHRFQQNPDRRRENIEAIEATLPAWEALAEAAIQGVRSKEQAATQTKNEIEKTLHGLKVDNANLKAELEKLKAKAAQQELKETKQTLDAVQVENVSDAAETQSRYFAKLAA